VKLQQERAEAEKERLRRQKAERDLIEALSRVKLLVIYIYAKMYFFKRSIILFKLPIIHSTGPRRVYTKKN
jgi:hypothetical protein